MTGHVPTLLLASLLLSPLAAAAAPRALAPEVEAELARLRAGATTTVVVHLAGQRRLALRPAGRRAREVAASLRADAEVSQRGVRRLLEARRAQGRVARAEPFWIFDGLSVTATAEVIRELAARPDVAAVTLDAIDVVPLGAPAEPNVAAVRAPEVWSLGHAGQGAVVAVLDSGVDVAHPDLAPRWRGGAGAWYDPYGQHATPYDPTGHGTWTTGVVVGGDAGGTSVGVAPGARFIAAKVFPDAGAASATAIHRAFQWALDPDGDPATDDAPSVVNGSWALGAPGCNLEFQADVQALRAGGILPVFAAGNYGPGAGTSVSPANYPESLAVGAVDGSGAVYYSSSRGPSACGGGQYPTLVAPGVDVWTTDLLSWYLLATGTSVAAPHVSGVAALLAGAFPASGPDAIEAALEATAADLGPAGPDPDSGNGMVDALAAYQALAAAQASPPVAADDAFAVVAGTSATFSAPGVLSNDASPAGRPLSALLTAPPASGALTLRADGGFDYTPAAGFTGQDSFRYRAGDGALQSAEAAVTLAVAAPVPPTAVKDAFSLAEDSLLSTAAPGLLANDLSPAGRPLSAVLESGPSSGALTLRGDGSFDFRPALNFAGAVTFSYRASDGLAASAPALVTLTVTPVNDPPVAVNDAATTRAGVAVSVAVTANDRDVDGTVVSSTVAVVSGPRRGRVSSDGKGTLTYTPNRGFKGSDSFTYRVRDDVGAWSNTASVSIQVN
jgi:subtilisin family serine protease